VKDEVRFCTAGDCNRLTTLYLCTSCVLDFDDLLQDRGPILDRIDAVIYRLTQTSAPGAGGGGVASSKPAMNVDAFMLKAHLHSLTRSAHAEAMENPEAGRTLFMAREWITNGRDLVWGPEDKRVYGKCGLVEDPDPDIDDDDPQPCPGQLVAHPDDATVKCPECNTIHSVAEILAELRERVRGRPTTPSAVRSHLQRMARVTVTKFDIENWVKRRKVRYVLDRVGVGIREQRLYYPGDVLTVAEETRARRRC
jgi:hypothetical protein